MKVSNQSISSSIVSRKYHECIRRFTARLSNNQSNDQISRAIVRLSVTHIICRNNSSVSVIIIILTHNKMTAIIHQRNQLSLK